MKICDKFNEKTVFSFEIFPPKRDKGLNSIKSTIKTLSKLQPDYISVTYGASGSENNNTTAELASLIQKRYNIDSVAHLTCVNLSREQAKAQLELLKEKKVENILALRGDMPPDNIKGDFSYASDLVKFIKQNCNDFCIGGACYPEGHTEAKDLETDIKNLKIKTDAGAEHLISQLFFDNVYFYKFVKLARAEGIKVPIQAGIMPVVNKLQIERMVSLCGATLPDKFLFALNKYENNADAMRDAGIAYAIDQIVDLITHGVDGIHLYTMNNSYVAQKIYQAVKTLI